MKNTKTNVKLIYKKTEINKSIKTNLELELQQLQKTGLLMSEAFISLLHNQTIKNGEKEFKSYLKDLENKDFDCENKVYKFKDESFLIEIKNENSYLKLRDISIKELNEKNIKDQNELEDNSDYTENFQIIDEIQNTNEVEIIEDIESIEGINEIEDVEDIEEIEDVEDIEEMEDVEDIEKIEDIEDLKDLQDLKEIKEIENFKDVEESKMVKDIKESKVEKTNKFEKMKKVDKIEDKIEDKNQDTVLKKKSINKFEKLKK